MDKPRGANQEPNHAERFAAPTWTSHGDSPEGGDASEESDLPVEYTWKTPLCECEDREEAWQIQEVLRQAGIESWLDRPGYYVAPEIGNPGLWLPPINLRSACEILAKPIPQEIVEQSKSAHSRSTYRRFARAAARRTPMLEER
jgi:hypothetical protein